MADWSLPTLSTLYTSTLDALNGRDEDSAKMFDGTGSNLPVGTIRWNSSSSLFEKYDGTSWNTLTAKYTIDVDTVDGLHGTQFLRNDIAQTYSQQLTLTYQGSAIRLQSGTGSSNLITGSDKDGNANGWYVGRGSNSSNNVYLLNYTNSAGLVVTDNTNPNVAPAVYVSGTYYPIFHQGNMGANSGLDADLLDGLHGYDYLTRGNQFTVKRYKTPGADDVGWKILYAVSMDDTTYEACLIKLDYTIVKTNYGHTADAEHHTFYLSMRRSGSVVNGFDDAVIYGTTNTTDLVKVIKKATGNYIVLIKQSDVYRNDQITSQVLSIGSGSQAYYYDTPGDGSASTGTEYFPQYNPNIWVYPTLSGTWADADTDAYGQCRYTKDDTGTVSVHGRVGGGSQGDLMFTLPSGYRPKYDILIPVWNGSSTLGTAGLIKITSIGEVIAHAMPEASSLMSMTFSFKAEQ